MLFVKSDSVFLRFPWLLTSLYCSSLIDFMPLIYFDTLWKHQKTRGFLMFSGRGYQKRSVAWNGLIEIVLCGTRLIRQNWKFRKKTLVHCCLLHLRPDWMCPSTMPWIMEVVVTDIKEKDFQTFFSICYFSLKKILQIWLLISNNFWCFWFLQFSKVLSCRLTDLYWLLWQICF